MRVSFVGQGEGGRVSFDLQDKGREGRGSIKVRDEGVICRTRGGRDEGTYR
jgi:hypothetical protein